MMKSSELSSDADDRTILRKVWSITLTETVQITFPVLHKTGVVSVTLVRINKQKMMRTKGDQLTFYQKQAVQQHTWENY